MDLYKLTSVHGLESAKCTDMTFVGVMESEFTMSDFDNICS